MQYCDCHAHLADERIRPQLDTLLADCARFDVTVLANAAKVTEWPVIEDLTTHSNIYGALGLHPFFLHEWDDTVPSRLRKQLTGNTRLRAIGEIGLDFYRKDIPVEKQFHVLGAQLQLAAELNYPVILHNRKSWSQFFRLLNELKITELRGVCHHFTGSREIARQALDRGLYLSFCGPLTYPNARRIKAAAAYAPLDRILTETDTPDLPVHSHRGSLSSPPQVIQIVAELAQQKKTSGEVVRRQICENFRTLLHL
mgnify:CR=1 FL=1